MSRHLVLAVALAVMGDARSAEEPLRQTIDARIKAVWNREKIQPSARADDASFMRRVYLDFIGRNPTPDEVTAFVLDSSVDKRNAVIQRLLADPRFG